MTSIKADLKLALSISGLSNQPDEKLFIVPPLLRQKVLNAEIESEDFILGYILNEGFAEEVIAWHMKNPHKKVHIFWDKKMHTRKPLSTGTWFFIKSMTQNLSISCGGARPIFLRQDLNQFVRRCTLGNQL